MQKQLSFKKRIHHQLKIAAREYAFYLNKVIILKSDKFRKRKYYQLRFYETNFLHLTGVVTKLSAWDFYTKCFNGIIKEKEFEVSVKELPQVKGYIRLKMKNLVNISSFFDKPIFVQEEFKRNLVSCLVATADNKMTLGFVDTKFVARPITLLDRNRLDKHKPIYRIKAKIVKIKLSKNQKI